MDDFLDPVLSSRRTSSELARGLVSLNREQQDFALHWTNVIRRSNAEMAFQFVSRIPVALKLLGIEGSKQWLLGAMEVYDKQGLYPGSAALDKLEAFAAEYRLSHISVSLDEIKHILETFICGLAGRTLKLEVGSKTYTDTETIYLPEKINLFDNKEQNYRLYKALATHLWAQTWFGTFKRETPDSPYLCELISEFNDSGRALRLFNLLETIRLNSCISRELPGLGREILTLHAPAPIHDATWKLIIDQLEQKEATVKDTLQGLITLYPLQSSWPESLLYQGELDFGTVEATIEQRVTQEKATLQELLAELLNGSNTNPQDGSADSELEIDKDGEGKVELSLDGESMDMSAEMRDLVSSLLQDLESLPEDWLNTADSEEYNQSNKESDTKNEWQGTFNDAETILYDEWDYRRQSYRKNWCAVRELTSHPAYDQFVPETLKKYTHLVSDIRRHFEALRGEDKILKAQTRGDDIDLDALVSAYSEMSTGVEMTDRLYIQSHKMDRDLAVIFMVDVSGSTKGWINEAERESLVLLCEALEILRDQYAIYAFSGMTRNRCEIYQIKTFDEAYDSDVKARISGLRPQDYTRMGVTIRHLTQILNTVEAKTRLMITLSDGKPDDYDGYRGEYGIEDTRQALLEARNTGIHSFCITIDTEASEYLPHMYGPANFTVIDDVHKLPLKVADIYRTLTT